MERSKNGKKNFSGPMFRRSVERLARVNHYLVNQYVVDFASCQNACKFLTFIRKISPSPNQGALSDVPLLRFSSSRSQAKSNLVR